MVIEMYRFIINTIKFHIRTEHYFVEEITLESNIENYKEWFGNTKV